MTFVFKIFVRLISILGISLLLSCNSEENQKSKEKPLSIGTELQDIRLESKQ